jgi:hypothetical protein
MTQAFDTFITQHNMTGSEKADGYSDDAFIGISDEEKPIVFALLTEELPWSARWLFLLDKDRALATTKELEATLRKQKYGDAYMLQEEMVKYSGDLTYQQHMIEDYGNYDDNEKPRVIDAISRTPMNEATVAFFKRVILTETNGSAVARASRHLLNGLDLPRSSEQEEQHYKYLVEELRSDDVNRKLKALEKIRPYEELV